jgi:hypothetical protein
MRLAEATLRDLEAGRVPYREPGFDPGDMDFEAAFDALGETLLAKPMSYPQVFENSERLNIEYVRGLDFHTDYGRLLNQLSEEFRTRGVWPYTHQWDDPLVGAIVGTFSLSLNLLFDEDPSYPFRGAWPHEVANMSECLSQVSEEDFLRPYPIEKKRHKYSSHAPRGVRNLVWRERYRHALRNLKAFYAVAAREGQAMLYSVG